LRLGAVFLVSTAALAYEVLLTRILAIAQWHHFAYMVISLALLGYGASGSFLAVAGHSLRARPASGFAANAVAFALAAVGGAEIATRLPFNALAIFWEPHQLVWLAALYLVFAVPFFFAANAVGLALTAFPEPIGRIYRADLAGAGSGALAIVGALFLLTPEQALVLLAALALLAAVVVDSGVPIRRRLAVPLLALPVMLPWAFQALPISPYKALPDILRRPQARIVTELSSPLARLTVVESPVVPLRHAPGLSLTSPATPPPQLALFTDANGPEAITRFDGRLAAVSYLDQEPAALPYHLSPRPRLLVLGLGGGAEVLRAIYHQARSVTVAEPNRGTMRLLARQHADFAGRILQRPEVSVRHGEPRTLLARETARYDLIVVPPLSGVGAGMHGLGEDTLHTVEAFRAYLKRLTPGGWIALSGPLRLPPRDNLKMILTAAEALRELGVDTPERHLLLLRGWGGTALAIGREAIGAQAVARFKAFADSRGFDLAYYPGMSRSEANRVNRLSAPMLYDGAAALLADAETRRRFLAAYPFDLSPARDDRPYAGDFLRWRGLPELWRVSRQGGAVLLDWGQLILVATLAQAVLLSAVLILLPLRFSRKTAASLAGGTRALSFFALIGAGFLFIEIASMQRFVLLLGHPLYAVAGVLAAFLLSAGVGAGLAPKLSARTAGTTHALNLAVGLIVFFAGLHLALLPALAEALQALPEGPAAVLALAAIVPLGIAMGMPFPLVLARLRASRPELVPWAWGMNGFASVASAVLAKLLAMSIGFTGVIGLAVLCYLGAAWAARRVG